MSITHFWSQFSTFWPQLYELIRGSPEQRVHALELINGLLTAEDFKAVQIEMTYGEINRNAFPCAKDLVELYISPRLLKTNVNLVEQYYQARPTLPNLAVYKYRAYNPSDPLIENVVYPATETTPEYTANYTDLGYQSSTGYDGETKKPMLNLVIYVKKPLADIILRKKKVTFTNPADASAEPIIMEKWLPQESTVVDLFLLNVLGEFHLVNDIGYIEFLPDGDPLIANGSVFCELADLRGDVKLLESSLRAEPLHCKVCSRHQRQGNISSCSKCKTSTYCSVMCQRLDFPKHKLRCKVPETSTSL